MSYKLIIFPTPLDAICEIRHDSNGVVIRAKPDNHPSSRPGQSFVFPDGTPNRHGARLVISAPKKVTLIQRGIVELDEPSQTASFFADDFQLQDEKVCPEIPVPTPIIPDKPTNSQEFKEWFFKQVEGKPFSQQTLLDLESALIAVGSALTPPNAVGNRTKIQDPFTKQWIRVGFGEGHWVWVIQ